MTERLIKFEIQSCFIIAFLEWQFVKRGATRISSIKFSNLTSSLSIKMARRAFWPLSTKDKSPSFYSSCWRISLASEPGMKSISMRELPSLFVTSFLELISCSDRPLNSDLSNTFWPILSCIEWSISGDSWITKSLTLRLDLVRKYIYSTKFK